MNRFNNVLAIHCHTTGLNFSGEDKTEGHQVLSVALAVLDLDNVSIKDSIFVKVKHDESIKWNTDLEAIHGISFEEATNAEEYSACAEKLAIFIASNFNINGKIPLFGYNVANFHLPFLQKILHSEDLYFDFDARCVDLFPISTLLNKFSIYDALKALAIDENGPISSEDFIKKYTKMYKLTKAMVNQFVR